MDQCFDAETTALLCRIFDETCEKAHEEARLNSVRVAIARRLIEIAGRGERDPDTMCEAALASLGLKPNRFTISPLYVAASQHRGVRGQRCDVHARGRRLAEPVCGA
jgi:hypothetical protein